MKDNATIRIKSICVSDEDIIEMICTGGYYEKNGNKYIIYDEKEEMGMANCSVMIKIAPEEVTVTRKGDFSSKMLYKPGKVTEFIYYMPYGSTNVTLNTKNVKQEFDEKGGELKLSYCLTIGGEEHNNVMTVKVEVRE